MKRLLTLLLLIVSANVFGQMQPQPSGVLTPLTTNQAYFRASDSTYYFYNGTNYLWNYFLNKQQADKLYTPINSPAITPFSLSTGYGLVGSSFNGSVARTWTADTASVDGLVSKSRLATNLGGYVPKSRTITINGATRDLSTNRTWNVGTVTSVGTGYGLLGGAITSSGTLSVDTSAIATKSYTNKYVPYDNATKNVNLGEFGIRAGYALLDTTPTNTPTTRGTIYWDTARSTAALIMNGTTQEIGQDSYFYVKNSTGSPIAKGTAVRFAGTDGGSGHLLIAPFLANGTYPSSYFMGVTAEAIANGGFGQVMNFGELKGVNTNAYVDGDLLYASTSSAGGFQTTAPVAPNNIVLIAAVVNAANNGTIIVRPTYGSNINDDEGVKITNPLAGDVLQYKSSGLWENEPLDSAGIVPTSRTITINGTTQNLSANRTWNVGTVTSVAALTLGTSGNDLSSTVANGTTTPVITLNVPTASATNRGALSSADWTTFNNKQNALTNPVTGTGTTNELAYFTGSTTIASLTTATYPSLTELSYVKGVTSSIQTQLNAKQGTLTLTTVGTSGAATLIGSTLNIPNYADGGVLSLSAIGSSPNANGGTITGTVLNLEPASASFGGVVTTGTQTFAGDKTFTGNINATPTTGNAIQANTTTSTAIQTSSTSGDGVSATATTGIALRGATSGTLGIGVSGNASGTGGIGGSFIGSSNAGYAVYAQASGSTTVGVYATANSSTAPVLRSIQSGAGNIALFDNSGGTVATITNGGGFTMAGVLTQTVGTSESKLTTTAGSGLEIRSDGSTSADRNIIFKLGTTVQGQIYNSGNWFIGSSPTDAGYKLDVNGTGRFSGNAASPITSINTGGRELGLFRTSLDGGFMTFQSSGSNTRGYIGNGGGISSASESSFGIRSESDLILMSGGNNIRLTIASTGAATFSSSVEAAGFYSYKGTTSVANATWVTIYTIPSTQAGEGVYNAYAHYNDDTGGMAFTQVLADRTYLREINNSDGATVLMQISGRNIQVYQSYGVTVDIQWSILWQKLR